MITDLNIRSGAAEDIQRLWELIAELAAFERASQEFINTPEQLLEDGFGKNPLYGFLVAERDNKIIGMSLYYFRYSTWKGKVLYLEDLIVTESERGKGVGSALFEATLARASKENCNRLSLQVLDWNEPAIDFYRKYGALLDTEWTNAHFIL